jgi:MSHA biogenesis protein MshM
MVASVPEKNMGATPENAVRATNYLQHFGLREAPFGITPDPAFLFACRSIREALKALLTAVFNGECLVKVTGEVGTGKTLLCRKFLATLDGSWVPLYIPNPSFDPHSLYVALAEDLGVAAAPAIDQHHLFKAITRALLELARQKKRVIVCVDEAQTMPEETLEALRLLTNLETEKRKLLQVVLFGQPELDEKLALPRLRQLLQRITYQLSMGTLEEKEVGAYVAHRMAVGGFPGPALLAKGDVRRLHRLTGGIPRLINVLMHKALVLAYGENVRALERRHLDAVAADTPAISSLGRTFMADARSAALPPASGEAMEEALQDMDRLANATAAGAGLRGKETESANDEWFWRAVAALLFAAVGWVGWVAYNLQPGVGLATEQAYRAAEEAEKRQSTGIIRTHEPKLPAQAELETQAPETPVRYLLRMEQSIQTPIQERAAQPQGQ